MKILEITSDGLIWTPKQVLFEGRLYEAPLDITEWITYKIIKEILKERKKKRKK